MPGYYAGLDETAIAQECRVLSQCFVEGEAAADYSAILATGEKNNTGWGIWLYRWCFSFRNGVYVFEVTVSGHPSRIESFEGHYWADM